MNNLLDDFNVPENIQEQTFIARKMCVSDVEIDYKAVMSSVDIIKKQMPGSWPDSDLTIEDDLIDLSWHQREFEYGSSFAYIVTDLKGEESFGCFYFFPTQHIFNQDLESIPEGSDVVIDFWVTQKKFDDGFYDTLKEFVERFIKQWPFKKPYYTNILK